MAMLQAPTGAPARAPAPAGRAGGGGRGGACSVGARPPVPRAARPAAAGGAAHVAAQAGPARGRHACQQPLYYKYTHIGIALLSAFYIMLVVF